MDLRRAISASYYAVFHAVAAALGDEFAGKESRNTRRYGMVYRSLEHSRLRDVCKKLSTAKPVAAYQDLFIAGPTRELGRFAANLVELRESRHQADYDPLSRFTTRQARDAIGSATECVAILARIDGSTRKAMLTLLLCRER